MQAVRIKAVENRERYSEMERVTPASDENTRIASSVSLQASHSDDYLSVENSCELDPYQRMQCAVEIYIRRYMISTD